jgi:nicotinate dehydrogenase subunit A
MRGRPDKLFLRRYEPVQVHGFGFCHLSDAALPRFAPRSEGKYTGGEALDCLTGDKTMTTTSFTLKVNGGEQRVQADGDTPLIDVLRNACGLKATRFGCGTGECGACHVLVEGASVPSCDTPLWAVDGKHVETVESFSCAGQPSALQQALLDEQAGQCGYCLSGILASATALLAREPRPSESQVRAALDRHLCRCGAHNRIVRAVLRACGQELPR